MNKYTDQELITFFKELSNELKKTPSQLDLKNKRKNDNNFPAPSVFYRRFGSNNRLVELCGMKTNHRYYEKEELLLILRKYCEENGVPSNADFDKNESLPSSSAYYSNFGSIRKALELIGIDGSSSASPYRSFTNVDIVNIINSNIKDKANINYKDIVSIDGVPSLNVLVGRFGGLDKLYEACNITYNKRRFSDFRNVPDETLLEKLREYSSKVGFPMTGELSKHEGYPSERLYYQRFGTLKNAIILAGIDIPEERKKNYGTKYNDEELLILLKNAVDKSVNSTGNLLSQLEIGRDPMLPSYSAYDKRFGTIENIYFLIGYDYHAYTLELKKKDMLEKYILIKDEILRIPTMKDIKSYSEEREGFYSERAYMNNFGSMYNVQTQAGLDVLFPARHKTKDELIQDLHNLHLELNRTPTYSDLSNCEYVSCVHKYVKEFGSLNAAFAQANIPINNSIFHYTKQGIKCLSSYELSITQWFEDNNIMFKKEFPYRNVITSDKTLRRFDWVVVLHNEKFYIEMFGMIGNVEYELKTKKKINDCKENNINLIELYPEDLKRPLNEVFSFLFENKE